MITARELDEIHLTAQAYAEQVKNEFMQSLMGSRMKRQQGAMPPQQMMQQEQMPMEPTTGGGYGPPR